MACGTDVKGPTVFSTGQRFTKARSAVLMFRPVTYWLWRRYSPGGNPTTRLKSRLNDAVSRYPTW